MAKNHLNVYVYDLIPEISTNMAEIMIGPLKMMEIEVKIGEMYAGFGSQPFSPSFMGLLLAFKAIAT